jgi:DNA-binding response OmpR family regulator
MRILVVEDHKELAATIAVGLRREGMAVDIAHDGEAALRHTRAESYDVVVLDRDLPRLHGDQVCRALVAEGAGARVIMLTAADTIESRVDGLNLGADDYLAKPFAFAELVARVRALARRTDTVLPPVLESLGVRLDTTQRIAWRDGFRLELSGKERAWDEYVGSFSNVVRVTISRLRRKLGDPPVIETVPQAGYRVAT